MNDIERHPPSDAGDVARLVAIEIRALLTRLAPSMRKPALNGAGILAGAVAAAMVGLPRRKQFTVASKAKSLSEEIVALIAKAADFEGAAISQPASASAVVLPSVGVEGWAGIVAGPTELERKHGISRSTLYRWQKLNDVIAFRAGGKKFVFPLAQFVDGRPATGIRDVLNSISDPRIAWQWLVSPCDSLEGRLPIDFLRSDGQEGVILALRKREQAKKPTKFD